MARKITAGISGDPSIGAIAVSPTATFTTAADLDISVAPSGTGGFFIDSNAEIRSGRELRFRDTDGSNYVGFTAPTLTANRIWTLPSTDGTDQQVLTTNGSGVISFTSKTVTISNTTTDASLLNISLTSATTGTVSSFTVSGGQLRYQPSTNTVFSGILTGGSSPSNTLTLRSTSDSTKGRVIIDETTASTSSTTGALTVAGGVGIAGRLNVAGVLAALGGSSGINNFNIITSATTLADADSSYLVIASSPYTITLPATTTDGRTITFIDGSNFASNNITLGRNTNNIAGAAEDLVLNLSLSFRLVYYQGNWRINYYNF